MNGRCLSCPSGETEVVLSFGLTPLANALRAMDRLDEPERRYPLNLAVCRHCSLTQLAETVEPSLLFTDYPYLSSYSETMLRHAEATAAVLIRRHALDSRSLAVELGSNDGYLLQYFHRAGVQVLGIDPSRAACAVARGKGIPMREAFFNAALSAELLREGRRADLIIANNVMAHVPDLNDVVSGIGQLLSPSGVFVMETPYLRNLVDDLEFDTIYHEHVFYYSLTALSHLFARHNLSIVDVERLPVHGGTLRVTAARSGSAAPRLAVAALQADEASWGVASVDTYRSFARRVTRAIEALRSLIRERRARGRRLAAYGAAAKGAMLLSALDLDDELEFVVDRNPRKQGWCLPGTRLPIYPTDRLLHEMPDDVLLLTWNLADEILSQERAYRERGGQFIVPIPEPHVV